MYRFTPLLASTAVGTLEFRSIAQPLLESCPDVVYRRASAKSLDLESRTVEIQTLPDDPMGVRNEKIPFDILAIGVGARNGTFNVPGVVEHAFFLKSLADAQRIRSTLIRNVETASALPLSDADKKRLLAVAIVGGGPTGIEFAAELHDFLREDLSRLYPSVSPYISITVIEGRTILSSFDSNLRAYTESKFKRDGVRILTGVTVTRVDQKGVQLSNGEYFPTGMCVWNTGIAPQAFTESLSKEEFRKDAWNHLLVDSKLRVHRPLLTDAKATEVNSSSKAHNSMQGEPSEPIPGIFSFGDAMAIVDYPIPATAQVAEQQGTYLAEQLNKIAKEMVVYNSETSSSNPVKSSAEIGCQFSEAMEKEPAFEFKNRGSLAFVGSFSALTDFSKSKFAGPLSGKIFTGFSAWFLWRSAYLTKLGSWRNRLQVPTDWARTFVFGRDTTQF